MPNDLSRQMPESQLVSGGLSPLGTSATHSLFQNSAMGAALPGAQTSHSKNVQRPFNSYGSFGEEHRSIPPAQSFPQAQYSTPAAYSTTNPNRVTDGYHRAYSISSNYTGQSGAAPTSGAATVFIPTWRSEPHFTHAPNETSRNGFQQSPSSWLNAPPKEAMPSLPNNTYAPYVYSQHNTWSNESLPPLPRSTHYDYASPQTTSRDGSEASYGNRFPNGAVGVPDLQATSPWTSTAVPVRETWPGGSRQSMVTGTSPVMTSASTGQYSYHNGGHLTQLPSYPSTTSGSNPYQSPSTVLSTPSSDGRDLASNGTYAQWPLNFVSPSMEPTVAGVGRASYQDDESRWHGVATRSHLADKFYLYGAMTTHIYCRPSCASKRPSRDRVQFFPHPDAAAAAEAAGFRSCKRCKPDRSGSDQTVSAVGDCVRHMMMAAASSAKEGGEPKKRTLKEYAARAGLSTFHFHRSLAKVMSITPGEYAKASQSMALQDALGIDNAPAGFDRISSKTYEDALTGWSARRAKRALGNIDPAAYSSGDLGIPIVRTSVLDTAYGSVSLVYTAGAGGCASLTSRSRYGAASSSRHDRAIFALLICPDADHRLARRFPRSIPGDSSAQQEVAIIIEELRRSAVREEQLPVETVASIRRARLWATIRKRLANHGMSGTVGPGGFIGGDGSGDDEPEQD